MKFPEHHTIAGFFILVASIIIVIALKNGTPAPPPPQTYTTHSQCTSDSMGLSIRCTDTLHYERVAPNATLKEGNIYIYRNGNGTIVHRLIYCIDHDCNQTVFKGDNNPRGEAVNRTDIGWVVTSINYTI